MKKVISIALLVLLCAAVLVSAAPTKKFTVNAKAYAQCIRDCNSQHQAAQSACATAAKSGTSKGTFGRCVNQAFRERQSCKKTCKP